MTFDDFFKSTPTSSKGGGSFLSVWFLNHHLGQPSNLAFHLGYAQLGLDEEALELFCRLQRQRMSSNYVTFASVLLLTALSALTALYHGKQVHSHIIGCVLPFYVVLQNSLIDIDAKCGKLTYSRRVLDQLSEKTSISWNAMLVGSSKLGMGREVIELYLMRQENKVKPDSITFLAVLSGCSHGGMEDKGFEIFNEMVSSKHGVELDIDHCGCIVDLLARASRVENAFEFIKQMPFEPTGRYSVFAFRCLQSSLKCSHWGTFGVVSF